ncbi:hypothetical protein [Sphingobacterium faecium]|uniref:hypothetical protein n=1 Tax=Sphingobacterium faecium TaxID=34087 RepID=UPI003209A4BE
MKKVFFWTAIAICVYILISILNILFVGNTPMSSFDYGFLAGKILLLTILIFIIITIRKRN